MKRYRVVPGDFDSTAALLNLPVPDNWDEESKEGRIQLIEKQEEAVGHNFGYKHHDQKIQNLRELGNLPLSVISYHNILHRQARDAFVIGAYYPALTASCALGERILNHLMLDLRMHYRSTTEYKKIANKKSFDNWIPVIDILGSWGVFQPEVVSEFKLLHRLRNDSIHFRAKIAQQSRDYALRALSHLSRIIVMQFGAIPAGQPWFIPTNEAIGFIAKDWEEHAFIKLVFVPNSVYVGPCHFVEKIEPSTWSWQFKDDTIDDGNHLTDDEYVERFSDFSRVRRRELD